MSASLGASVGALVRLRREQRGMSAAELARRAALSKATLSSIESGRGNPTLDTVDAIAAALAIPLVDLLDLGDDPATVVMPHRPLVADPIAQTLLHRLNGGFGLEVWRLTMQPGEAFEGVPHAQGTVEQLFVLAGGLTAGPAADERPLAPGDLIAFTADRPHRYAASADGADLLVLIASPHH